MDRDDISVSMTVRIGRRTSEAAVTTPLTTPVARPPTSTRSTKGLDTTSHRPQMVVCCLSRSARTVYRRNFCRLA